MNMQRHPSASRQQGLSLIELMVALTISFLVALGILQIFSASSQTYRMQEGLSRVQESGRYAAQFLQRELRTVGYEGCGSDTERTSQLSFVNHLADYSATVFGGDAVDPKFRFQRPIEAFAAEDLTNADLPAGLTVGQLHLVPGTDVLILRTVSEEAVPVINLARTNDNNGTRRDRLLGCDDRVSRYRRRCNCLRIGKLPFGRCLRWHP